MTIPLSGFQTPLSGAVNATVGIVAQEGDRATLGDGATIRGAGNVDVRLGNAANPGGPPQSAANVFNASISRVGAHVTDRRPAHVNNFGFDVDTFATTNVLGNNQTSTDVKLTTSGDAYIPGVVFIATELYAPQVAATKTVDKPTANLGEELTYTARFENTGADGAAGFVATDAIPDGTTYVSGSLAIDGVAQTDAGGDDRAEFDMAGDRVVARLGTGANATAGGTLAIGAASEVTFRVRIDNGGFAAGARDLQRCAGELQRPDHQRRDLRPGRQRASCDPAAAPGSDDPQDPQSRLRGWRNVEHPDRRLQLRRGADHGRDGGDRYVARRPRPDSPAASGRPVDLRGEWSDDHLPSLGSAAARDTGRSSADHRHPGVDPTRDSGRIAGQHRHRHERE